MRSSISARLLLTTAATLLAVGAPAVSSLARARHPAVEVIAPPNVPPPPPEPVGMPDQMIDDAAAYEGLMQRVAATSPGFSSAQTVATALRDGAAYEPKTFLRGAIAYAAVAALKDQSFVAALRDAGNTPDHRADMVRDIELNPAYLYQFKGSDAAAGYARAALGSAALNLYATGRLIHQAAYDVQHQPWSSETIVDRPGRLAAVKAASANGIAPAPDEMTVVERASRGAQPLSITAPPIAPPYTPMIDRALQVAAIAALGEATNTSYLNLASLTEEGVTEECLERAKRDLFQCLAVAKPNYEDVFCMGQHEMVDPGACLAKSVSVDIPAEPAPPPPPAPVQAAAKRLAKAKVKHHA